MHKLFLYYHIVFKCYTLKMSIEISENRKKHATKTRTLKFSEDPLATTEYSTSLETAQETAAQTNSYGQVKTSQWHRPKKDIPLKDLEIVSTRWSQRNSNMKKSNDDKVTNIEVFTKRLQQYYKTF